MKHRTKKEDPIEAMEKDLLKLQIRQENARMKARRIDTNPDFPAVQSSDFSSSE